MKFKTLRKKIFAVSVLFTLMLTGCFGNSSVQKEDSPEIAQLSGENANNPSGTGSQTSGSTAGNTLGSKLTGFFVQDSGEFEVKIVNFHDNLLAIGGLTSSNGGELYSFWTMEIIPENPEDLYDENKDEIRVGVKKFSIMSNLGRYWGPIEMGTIRADGKSLVLESDNGGDIFGTGGGTVTLIRDDDEDFFYGEEMKALDYTLNFEEKEFDKGLYGVWKQTESENPAYVVLTEGEDLDNFSIYKKEGGKEVTFMSGECRENDKEIYCGMTNFGDSTILPYLFEYSLSGDTLSLTSTEYGSLLGYDEYNLIFEKVDESKIPIVALYEPDDLFAIEGGFSMDMPDGSERPVIPEFKISDKVVNNGTEFIGIGDMVFFRCYDESKLDEGLSALWGDFTDCVLLCEGGCVGYYDTRTGECGIAYEDGCSGPLYYFNGKIFSSCTEDEDDYSKYGRGFCPDGSGMEETKDLAGISMILCVNDRHDRLAYYVYDDNSIYLDDGTIYGPRLNLEENESLLYSDFIGDDFYMVTYNYSENVLNIREVSDSYSVTTLLSSLDTGNLTDMGMPGISNIVRKGNDLYVGINWYSGTNVELQNTVVIKAECKKENSGVAAYVGMPEGMDYSSRPYVVVDDDVHFSEINPEGEVYLSEKSYGDLISSDSYGQDLIQKNFIQTSPFEGEEGELVTVFENGGHLLGKVFVVTANVSYKPEDDTGWRMAFELNGFNYLIAGHNGIEELHPFE